MKRLLPAKNGCRLLLLLLLAPVSLYAQEIVTEVPPEYEKPVEEWVELLELETSSFYKGRFNDTYAQEIINGNILAVAEDMILEFENSDWGENRNQKQKILNQLQRFKGAMKVALNTEGIEGALDKNAEQNIFLESLNDQNFGLKLLELETLTDVSGEDVIGYFGETDDELLLYQYLPDGERVELLLTQNQVREWRLLENALKDLIQKQVFLVSESNIRELKNAVVRWENFLDNGYSQMPWESGINGRLIKVPEFGPPDHQFIFMHPTLGLEFSAESFDETRVKEVLHIELLGHVWYTGHQLDNFRGISLSASLREDLDPGIGVMFHIQRNWSVGVAWHDVEEDPFLFFSVDLFRFAKQNATQYVKEYDAVRRQLGLN
ncbi:hypothetical protein N9850_04165 [Granulosicoccus sp.]|nr:hypothetical protein [Granulosicoccus sp.]MDB4222944.1 hypothetical protein [Granulosicoccus sp.]